MSRHTIGNRRGSVRGAPPSVYVGFATFHKSKEAENDAMYSVIRFFGFLFKGAGMFLLLLLFLVFWYALGEPD